VYFDCPRRLSGTIRRLAHLRVQIADALLPFIVFAPLFVRQAHIGFQFQCLDLLSEKVDKLGLEFLSGIFHRAFSHATVSADLGRRGAKWEVKNASMVLQQGVYDFG
jgi:hypothetical protein